MESAPARNAKTTLPNENERLDFRIQNATTVLAKMEKDWPTLTPAENPVRKFDAPKSGEAAALTRPHETARITSHAI